MTETFILSPTGERIIYDFQYVCWDILHYLKILEQKKEIPMTDAIKLMTWFHNLECILPETKELFARQFTPHIWNFCIRDAKNNQNIAESNFRSVYSDSPEKDKKRAIMYRAKSCTDMIIASSAKYAMYPENPLE